MENSRMQDPAYLREVAYRDSSRLNARIDFWIRYGKNEAQWYGWYFELFSAPKAARILEVGCGPGGMWKWGVAHGRVSSDWDITLTDLSDGMLDDAKRALASLEGTFKYRVADVCDIPFEDDSFDVVVANYMLYHASEIDQAVSEISRVLAPNGKLYAATNSEKHIAEFIELQKKFAIEADVGAHAGATHGAFTLENGPGILNARFSKVSNHADENIVRVTEPDLLVSFIESMDVPVDMDRLNGYIISTIEDEGFFQVTRSSGVLIGER